MDDLVKRLSKGDHKVAVTRANGDVSELKDMIERDFVLIKFTQTKGGTELGFSLDRERSKWNASQLENGTGEITLVGELNLNYEDVRCIAQIELPSLEGHGKLELVSAPPASA